MALSVFFNRVRFQATTTGTGAFGAGAAIAGFRAPTVMTDGTAVSYTAETTDLVTGGILQWETGHGVWHTAANNITRDAPLEGSAATPVSFTQTPIVWLDLLAQDLVAFTTQVQRSVTTSPITVATSDDIINCNITSGSPTCTLPAAATRSGDPIKFKDVGGQFAAHPLTITPNGVERIDGLASLTLSTNYQYLCLRPFNDGVNSGWLIEQ
jgi:hypothetical protein